MKFAKIHFSFRITANWSVLKYRGGIVCRFVPENLCSIFGCWKERIGRGVWGVWPLRQFSEVQGFYKQIFCPLVYYCVGYSNNSTGTCLKELDRSSMNMWNHKNKRDNSNNDNNSVTKMTGGGGLGRHRYQYPVSECEGIWARLRMGCWVGRRGVEGGREKARLWWP